MGGGRGKENEREANSNNKGAGVSRRNGRKKWMHDGDSAQDKTNIQHTTTISIPVPIPPDLATETIQTCQ
jgi:hypothetical protein